MKQFSIGLFILATLGTTLLTGQALGVKAFGGTGFIFYPNLEIEGTSWARGSTYRFSNNKAILIQEKSTHEPYYSGIVIEGEKGTEIIFEDTQTEKLKIRLVTGRITAKGYNIKVMVNKITVSVDGETEIIHYSWKNEAEVTAKKGAAHVFGSSNEMSLPAPWHAVLSTATGMIVL